jgi:hypothetical protein
MMFSLEHSFCAPAVTISIGAANNTLESAGRRDLMVNVISVRRQAMSGPRAAPPSRISRTGLQADKTLQSFLATGGVLDRRASRAMEGEPVEIKGYAHHAATQGA